jgi:ribose transport system substrate-binding protein
MSLRMLARLTALAVACLTACGTGGGSVPGASGGGGEKKPIGVSVADQKSLFYVAAVQGMLAEADKKGYKLVVTSATTTRASG